MQALAGFIMRGPAQAVAVVVVAAVLGIWFTPVVVVSAGALSLVTLRLGARPGLTVLGGAALVAVVAGQLAAGHWLAGAGLVAGLWLPSWGLAMLWRLGGSLALTVQAATALGLAVALGLHVALDEPAAFWRATLEAWLGPAFGRATGGADLERLLDQVAALMTGGVAASMVLTLVLGLLLGRYWQALLYNPGGLGAEFRGLNLGRRAGAVGLAVAAGAALTAQPLLDYFALVLVIPFLFQGLALVHALVARTGVSRLWLAGFYALMAIALPHVLALVSLAGLADTWLDFRARLPTR